MTTDKDHNEKSNLVGSNRMEILLFGLGGNERFGINVFKVREVCQAGKITLTPNMPNGVNGIISLRGHVMPVVDLASFMGLPSEGHSTMLVAEYSNHVLGFLVKNVDRIVPVEWDKVRPADGMLAEEGALVTSITELPDGGLVSIIDVEQVLSNAFGDEIVGEIEPVPMGRDRCVFFVDDSLVARRKIAEVLDKMGVRHMQASNGAEAWERLKSMADNGDDFSHQIQVVLTDVEMPEMDGYVLTQHIKSDRRFNDIKVVMHSSLSSEANRVMGNQVGVDSYVSKFDSGVLSSVLRPFLS